MTDPPTEIVCGPYRYEVLFSSGGKDFGHCDNSQQRIIVADDVHPARQRETLLHEVIHFCIHLTDQAPELPEKDEERLTKQIAIRLYEVLLRNPGFTDYLLDGQERPSTIMICHSSDDIRQGDE